MKIVILSPWLIAISNKNESTNIYQTEMDVIKEAESHHFMLLFSFKQKERTKASCKQSN